MDLIGYRRFGHNETDEPAYTQPLMYERIKAHPPVRELYADKLQSEGTVGADDAEAIATAAYQAVADAHEELKRAIGAPPETGEHELDRTMSREPRTTLPEDTLRTLNEQLLRVPEASRCTASSAVPRAPPDGFEEGRGIDWAHAEALAFASLLALGVPVRLTGQDTERGTFSQRHAVLHDPRTGKRWRRSRTCATPWPRSSCTTARSRSRPAWASSTATASQAPDALVLWEAQFGDFVNSAQVIVDQFLVSGLAKWGQTSRLSLLLPHGYEGSGPEHSSARLERFLQAAAEGNIRVANCTTPAQYFHLLRRQALVSSRGR